VILGIGSLTGLIHGDDANNVDFKEYPPSIWPISQNRLPCGVTTPEVSTRAGAHVAFLIRIRDIWGSIIGLYLSYPDCQVSYAFPQLLQVNTAKAP